MQREPVARLRGVGRTFSGANEVVALIDVDLDILRGEQLAIVGPSGSGKSTLLHVLGLLDQPTTGSYVLEGVETTTLSALDRSLLRARQVGFVFQSFHLLPYLTARENVELGLMYARVPRRHRRRLADEALEAVALGPRAPFLPPLLSGGERQRVAIARAIATQPRLLLADEPTGNLDRSTGAQVLEQFSELRHQGLTQVVVTHDPAVAAQADRRVAIVDGRLSSEPPGGGDA